MEPDFTLDTYEPESLQTFDISHASCVDTKSIETRKELQQNSYSDLSNGKRKRLITNNITLDCMVNAYNRERNVPTNQTATDHSPTHKNFKVGTLGLNDNIDTPSYLSGNRNLNFKSETSTDRIFDHESQTYCPETQASENFGKQTTTTLNQNVEPNINILRESQNGKEQITIQDSREYIGEQLLSSEYFVKAGTSGLHENTNVQILCLDKMKSNNLVKIEYSCIMKKTFACRICDKSLDEHVEIKENGTDYLCCICRFKTYKKVLLQLHCDLHCPKTLCNKCEREYTEGDAHESEHTCQVCQEKFECKTPFDLHAVDHDEYSSNLYLWACDREIMIHSITYDGITNYVCCACGYQSNLRNNFMTHNMLHCPKFYCMKCRQEYLFEERNLHGKSSICTVCEIQFECHTLLEQHTLEHESHFYLHCICCQKYLMNHKRVCCVCHKNFRDRRRLQYHLYTHKYLKPFKCDVCGKRYANKYSLEQHSKTCIPLPEKCEICKARFPNKESLDKHRLEKHNMT